MNKILHFLLLLYLCSCSAESEYNDYIQAVKNWHGRNIILPDTITDILTNKNIHITDNTFTILTYVDSLGCTECNMKIALWNEFRHSLDSLLDCDINILMIVNVANANSIKSILLRNKCEFPVFADTADICNLRNKFEINPSLRTLLLDSNQSVIAIGNPVLNLSSADLYRSIISGKSTSSDISTIKAINNHWNFGKIATGETTIHDFSLKTSAMIQY